VAPVPSLSLGTLASQPVMVVPVQYLRTGESLGWSAQIARPKEYLAGVDSAIAKELTARGLKPPTWAFAADVARIAQRNRTVAPDPFALSADVLRGGSQHVGDQLADQLASQLRNLIAFHDARMLILPVEVRFETVGTAGRALMRVAVVDVRAANLRWLADVPSDTASAFSPALAGSIARRLADLIVAR
jgi:hypothetical protein